jgi:2-polyprenyl-3-methyl-5-hydroxy-6-metoxy-1,4-benzoquinol methylase
MPLEAEIHKAYTNSYYTHGERARHVRYVPPAYGPLTRSVLWTLWVCLGGVFRLHTKRDRYWLHGLVDGKGRLLEVGCGNGSRLLDLQKRGWVVEGQEIDPQAASYARSKGLHVHEGSLDHAGLPDASYEVILLSHVLEHVHRPVEILRECGRLLKPGGRLVLSTPNIESLGHRIYKRDWLALDPPRHLVIHSRRSLERVLRDAGFGDTSIRTVPLNCELTSMHSRDIKYLGWTDLDSMPRVGREIVPVALQLAAILLHPVAPGSGEECFAVARRAGTNGRSAPR